MRVRTKIFGTIVAMIIVYCATWWLSHIPSFALTAAITTGILGLINAFRGSRQNDNYSSAHGYYVIGSTILFVAVGYVVNLLIHH